MDFCKQFNDRSRNMEAGMTIPVVITVYEDRSFTFITKMPPVASLLKRAAGLAKASGEPNRNKVGKITLKQAEEIADAEDAGPQHQGPQEPPSQMVKGTARSMGIEITRVRATDESDRAPRERGANRSRRQ